MRRTCVGRVLRRGCALVLAAGFVLVAPRVGSCARAGEQVDARGRLHERKWDSPEASGGVVHLDRVVRAVCRNCRAAARQFLYRLDRREVRPGTVCSVPAMRRDDGGYKSGTDR